jgi:hypothetical protein
MPIKKYRPQSPDPFINKIKGDTEFARLAHINNLVDQINTTVYVPPTTQTFDPLFTDLGEAIAGVTSQAHYTMLSPKICFFRVYVDFANCTNFGTTQYQITLPFPSAETMRQAGGTLHQLTGAALYHIAGITDVAVSASIHKLYYSGSVTDLAWKNSTPVGATTTSSHFDISGIYEII